MKNTVFAQIQQKILSYAELEKKSSIWKKQGETVVFTNGCFDLLHLGHISYLTMAKSLGTKLVVGMNSTSSIKQLKGPKRPINDQETRTTLMAAFAFVDAVSVFEEDTPIKLINACLPQILVKGGDWKPEQIVGSDIVLRTGGKVLSLPFITGYSSTNLIEMIVKSQYD